MLPMLFLLAVAVSASTGTLGKMAHNISLEKASKGCTVMTIYLYKTEDVSYSTS